MTGDDRRIAVVVVMGVAGAGKTVVGRRLASSLGWRFLDADDFHPAENIERMRLGLPLSDSHRGPWLDALRVALAARIANGERIVLACSALRQTYRDVLATAATAPAVVYFVYLRAPLALLRRRLDERGGHFFPPELLESQLDALEEPIDALSLDAARAPDELVGQVTRGLGLRRSADEDARGD